MKTRRQSDLSRRLALGLLLACCAGRVEATDEVAVSGRSTQPGSAAAAPAALPLCGPLPSSGPPESYEPYPLLVESEPARLPAREPITLHLSVLDPRTGVPARGLLIVQERAFHLFLVSEQLDWFEHLHPERLPDGSLSQRIVLPRSGRYQLIADFFPLGGTPQLVQRALVTAGWSRALRVASLPRSATKEARSSRLLLRLSRVRLVATRPVEVTLDVLDDAGRAVTTLEPYLGALLHGLAVSADLADAVHVHGDLVAPGQIRFELRLPRAGSYRLWVQVQVDGVVHTVPFTVTASPPSALAAMEE